MKRCASSRKSKPSSNKLPKTDLDIKKINDKGESTSKNQNDTDDLISKFEKLRLATAKSILDFNFKKQRIRILSNVREISENAKSGILYWMFRDMRVQDNWAFLFAQKLALKNQIPLHVCFCLLPTFLNATIRHYKFLMKGLQEVENECKDLNINFHLFFGTGPENIPKFVKDNSIDGVVCDLSPLNKPKEWVEEVKNNLPESVPFCLVDAHNIVPVWIASDKQEYAARTIRGKINQKLSTFLTEFPPLIKHPYKSAVNFGKANWDKGYDFIKCDKKMDEVEWAVPGYRGACKELKSFCEYRLQKFHSKRNDPTENALSNLSPWYHFGQISPQRCILTVNEYKKKYPESVAAYCEEAIIRRELSENFCFYNENYDNLKGVPSWAHQTLMHHKKDKRTYVYELNELEQSKTHDDLWNAAQIQLVKEGKMHGFLRMYWAKKILEWSETPERALENAIYLNDRYNLDGRDPNGYVGCMWSIGGVHDQGWTERPIFGKIRYMNYEGCKRKFNVAAFVARYGGKVHEKS